MKPTTWKTWCSGIVYELVINQLYTPFGKMLCSRFQEEFLQMTGGQITGLDNSNSNT